MRSFISRRLIRKKNQWWARRGGVDFPRGEAQRNKRRLKKAGKKNLWTQKKQEAESEQLGNATSGKIARGRGNRERKGYHDT